MPTTNSKPLPELNAEWVEVPADGATVRALLFECPVCPDGHGILAGIGKPSLYDSKACWRVHRGSDKSLDHLTLVPSINCATSPPGEPGACTFHGWVRDGSVIW